MHIIADKYFMDIKKHGFMSMLRRGSHYKMERFIVMFSTLIVCIAVVAGMCFYSDVRDQDTSIQTKSMEVNYHERQNPHISRTGEARAR